MTYTRNCPECNKEISYTNKNNCSTAERKQSKCFDCGIKNRRNYSGKNNPFFGQNHTDKSKQIISKFNSEERVLSAEFIQKAKDNLSKVTNNRPIYDIWLEKYGKDKADILILECKKKQSTNNSGSNNPMFGKPSPQGSGNGWSGWYKGWYFRSIRELSYMINIIETQGLLWETPKKLVKITYTDYKGNLRTYFPDFIIGNKMIEIKPTRLHNSPKVLAKKNAAEQFCILNGMVYELIDPPILSQEEIIKLYLSRSIKFLERYEKKFIERYLNA